MRQNKKTKHLQYLYSACVLRDVVLLQHPVVSRMQQCMCSTGVNVGACTKINCTMRLLVQHSASQNDSSDWASKPKVSPSAGLQAGQHGGQGLRGQLRTLGLILVWGQTSHNGRTSPLQECHTRLDKRFLETKGTSCKLRFCFVLHFTGVFELKEELQALPRVLWFCPSATYRVWGIHGEKQVQRGQLQRQTESHWATLRATGGGKKVYNKYV